MARGIAALCCRAHHPQPLLSPWPRSGHLPRHGRGAASWVPDISLTDLDSQHLALFPALSRFISSRYELTTEFPDFLVYRRKSPGPIPVIPGGGP